MRKFLVSLIDLLTAPLSLFLVWVYGFKPFSYLYNKYNLNPGTAIPDTIQSGIDVAVSLFLLKVIGKFLNLVNDNIKRYRPTLLINIINPRDPEHSSIINCDVGGSLKRVNVCIEVDYKNKIGRFLATFGLEHVIELYWLDSLLTLQINSSFTGEFSEGYWKYNLSKFLSQEQYDTKVEIPVYLTVNHGEIKKSYITPKTKIAARNQILGGCATFLSNLFTNKNFTCLTIKINNE
jgi:hypothetical protein